MKSVSPNFIPSLLDLMPDIGPMRLKKEVGQIGFFVQDRMFGLVSAGQFWMRANPDVCPITGQPLPPSVRLLADKGHHFLPVPDHILKDKKAFSKWARWAVSA